jgi:hypothetical protein
MSHSADQLSELERGVLLAMAQHDVERETLLRQIETARVIDRDYTGVGLYTKLEVGDDVPKLRTTNRLIEDYPKISLEHPDLEVGAGVILWLDDARIDTIEFYTYTGDWPKDESAFRIEQEAQQDVTPNA